MRLRDDPRWIDFLGREASQSDILKLRQERLEKLDDPKWEAYQKACESLKSLEGKASSFSIVDEKVTIGKRDDLSPAEHELLLSSLDAFRPWKKGPYSIFGHEIDSEWRSDIKWNRVMPKLGTLEGEVVADIGCHNGYFMYRMLKEGARHVVGFEPVPINAYNHELLQRLSPEKDISFELFGVEHIDLFPETFDTIFCMGILYHHTDPVGLLRKMKSALKKKGRLVIDCQGIPGEESLSLTPSGRYAGASGVWFLPTLSALQNWVKRSGFSQQKTIFSEALSIEEQRATPWADVKSLNDFLDPEDRTRTIEGYPAPYRHYIIATA